MGKFHKLFESGKREGNVAELPLMQRLYRYVLDVRCELRVFTNKWWKVRKTHWQLNYEDNEEREFGDKYDGEFWVVKAIKSFLFIKFYQKVIF